VCLFFRQNGRSAVNQEGFSSFSEVINKFLTSVDKYFFLPAAEQNKKGLRWLYPLEIAGNIYFISSLDALVNPGPDGIVT